MSIATAIAASLRAGCAAAAPAQNALAPAGPQAAHIYDLWWIMLLVCTGVWVAVLVALGLAVRRASVAAKAVHPAAAPSDAAMRWPIGVATALSTILLIGLTVASIGTDRALASLSLRDPVRIAMTAHQWWWEIRYDDDQPTNVFSTANEMHIPVGRPVVITLAADDVIHSFWVPNLHGKKDMIPGRTSFMELQADHPGTYRGQCAEFCGYQHANMALDVIAEAPDDYERWLRMQRAPAAQPEGELRQHGADVFLASTCAMCHGIVGSQAGGQRAPDLTHLASRRMLGAGTIPNTPSYLAAWVVDAPAIKPGVAMPPHVLSPSDLESLVAYLTSLK